MIPKVSIPIPCFNYGQYLDEAVDSVLSQTFQDFEIVIVDDKSTDNTTVDVVKAQEKKDSRIKTFFHSENKRMAGARNTAIRESSGRFIVPLDADDKLHPDFLQECYNEIVKGRFHIISTDMRFFGTINKDYLFPNYNLNGLYVRGQFPVTVMYHKIHWEQVGGYNETFTEGYEDWEFAINMGEHSHTGYHISKILFYYRWKDSSTIHNTMRKKAEIIARIKKLHPHPIYKSR